MSTVIELSIYNIKISGNRITSILSTDELCETDSDVAAMSAIEAMILAHHCAGIDVTTPQYKIGIEVAVEAYWNNVL